MRNKYQSITLNRQAFSYFFALASILILARLFLCNPTLGLDEAEQIVFAQKLSAGYPSQPPLYTWLQYFVFQSLGVSLFSVALLKYSLLFLCIYFYHQICRLYCQNSLLVWCATLSWALIPNISYDLLPHRTHAILALLAACLTWYWFIRPTQLSKWSWSIIWGLIIGVGLLSKFNYLIFLAIFLFTVLSINEYRSKLLNPYFLITLTTALLLSSPYWIWLLDNAKMGLYSSYKLALPGKNQWSGIGRLFQASVCFAIPVILILFFFPLSRARSAASAANQLLWRYHLFVMPFLLLIVVSAGIYNVKTHWVLPLFFLSPLWLFSIVNEQAFSVRHAKYFLGICFVVQATLIGVWIVRTPHLAQFPVKQFVNEIKEEHHPFAAIVSDSHWLLGSLMLYLPNNQGILMHPVKPITLPAGNLLFIWEGEQSPWWVNNLAAATPQLMTQAVTTRNDKASASHRYRLQTAQEGGEIG
ncbi:glycosyltransferase family 39 protein [Legionella cardiaca]|uniref:Glycosyltransferase family 39 protein n=1 Tax=Legionella cardiaca TaxID=1071983 RepID=A0ABY8AT54_9GAMM|nr:glycosyltransferase family 39 protein [Legionella cardiaca]WED42327.1 glycosyltransferase family 39 protein [Legionella cardiaca]